MLSAKQQQRTSFPTFEKKNENFTPKSDFHQSCAIKSKFRPQHQESDDYSTSLHYFGLIFRIFVENLHF